MAQIIYYEKASGKIDAVGSGAKLDTLKKAVLDAGLVSKYPTTHGDMAYDVVDDDVEAQGRGTWSPVSHTQIAEPPVISKVEHPEKARLAALRTKITAKTAAILRKNRTK